MNNHTQSETDQFLQRAIQHHRSNEYDEAKVNYMAVLQAESTHAIANHNLGLLLLQQGNATEGLPYFIAALNSDVRQVQYWLSYIDALFKAGQLEEAKQTLLFAKQYGLEGERVDSLERLIHDSGSSNESRDHCFDSEDVDAFALRLNGGGGLTVSSNTSSNTRAITFKNYCVSHELPLLPDQLYDFVIGLGDYFPDRGINISKLDTFWHENRPLAYGAAGNYTLPNAIKINGELTNITGVSSHRKIVSRIPIGREASNYPGLRLVSTGDLSFLTLEDIKPYEGYNFLISRPVQFIQGIFSQYNSNHHIADLLEYTSIAVQLGILSSAEVNEFIAERILFPGGCEMGVFPTIWLAEILSKLESVGREFILRAGNRIRQYDSYQVRAVGFLSERLGSFFLHKELIKRYPSGIPNQIFGFMCNVQNGSEYTGTQIMNRPKC